MLAFTTISNENGMQVTLCNYGARITSIEIDKQGQTYEMLCSSNNVDSILQDKAYMGAVCGAVSNRIKQARFTLNGTDYKLDNNENEQCLHGGKNAISNKFWSLEECGASRVIYKVSTAHLEDGFPGDRDFYAEYSVDKDNSLNIHLYADSNRDTPINMTSHAYFSLAQQNPIDLLFKLNATQFLEKDSNGLPTGKLIDTDSLGFDLSQWNTLSSLIKNSKYQQIIDEQGIDHCFIVNNNAQSLPVVEVMSKQHPITLHIYSNQKAIQVYTGHGLSGQFSPYQGICFESQGYNDAVNQPAFPSTIVSAGTQYSNSIKWRFG